MMNDTDIEPIRPLQEVAGSARQKLSAAFAKLSSTCQRMGIVEAVDVSIGHAAEPTLIEAANDVDDLATGILALVQAQSKAVGHNN